MRLDVKHRIEHVPRETTQFVTRGGPASDVANAKRLRSGRGKVDSVGCFFRRFSIASRFRYARHVPRGTPSGHLARGTILFRQLG
jgi:hypothetical protein